MTKVTWSVPLVQFGRCEIEMEASREWLADPEKFGREYADFVAGAMRGYETRVEEIRTGAVKTVKDTLGATEIGESSEAESVKERRSEGRKAVARELDGMGEDDAPSWERKVEKSEPWKSGGPVKKPAKIEWN